MTTFFSESRPVLREPESPSGRESVEAQPETMAVAEIISAPDPLAALELASSEDRERVHNDTELMADLNGITEVLRMLVRMHTDEDLNREHSEEVTLYAKDLVARHLNVDIQEFNKKAKAKFNINQCLREIER